MWETEDEKDFSGSDSSGAVHGARGVRGRIIGNEGHGRVLFPV